MPALYSHLPCVPKSCPKAKAKILINRFSLPLQQLTFSILKHHQITLKATIQGKITIHKIQSTILGSISKKATGEDGILNLILKLLIDLLLPHLYRIFNNCLNAGFCPTHFWSSITVVIRKPRKPDYTIAKVYCPIALLNTLEKALEFILAKKVTYLAKTHGLLPHNHFGARRARSTKHALHYI